MTDNAQVRALMEEERRSLAANLVAWRRAAAEVGCVRLRMWNGEMTRGLSIALDAASCAMVEVNRNEESDRSGRQRATARGR